ncbi:hypothetical protein NC652_041015 [Populus alba x Populus x berolinensis]|uniref:Uncharacterized protein n=1 Tax=Populus alba x Populus x berolinensis TaxID=444605 RepID=A0AAD6PQF7_9ROSI|nr:hypothetical protein NC652_041015 [Populus alba x Populus x berolinensis]KAJ6951956.1 hypothetical protein NC653_041201 [Populus alba x Populus x berolinensis]
MRELLTHALHNAKVINLPSHSAKCFKCKCRKRRETTYVPGLLVSSPSPCLRVPLVLVLTEDGGPKGYPAVMLLLLFTDLGGRIRLLCCSCLLMLKVAEELQLVMTAPLLVLAPSAEKKTQPLLAMGKRYRRMG